MIAYKEVRINCGDANMGRIFVNDASPRRVSDKVNLAWSNVGWGQAAKFHFLDPVRFMMREYDGSHLADASAIPYVDILAKSRQREYSLPHSARMITAAL